MVKERNANRWHKPITTGLTGITIAGSSLFFGRGEEPMPSTIASVSVPLADDPANPRNNFTHATDAPLHREQIQRTPIEHINVDMPATTTPIGAVLDLSVEDFSRYLFSCKENDSGAMLCATPLVRTVNRREAEYSVSGEDPIYMLEPSATPAQIEQYLNDSRDNLRAGYGIAPYDVDAPFKKHAMLLDNEYEVDHKNTLNIRQLPADGKLVVHIDLGEEHTAPYRWLEHLMSMPSELVRETDGKISSSQNSFLQFLKAATLDQSTGSLNMHAVNTLYDVFALTDESRTKLSQALSNNDMSRAIEIVARMSDNERVIDMNLVNALTNFAQVMRAQEMGKSEIWNAISRARIAGEQYDNLHALRIQSHGDRALQQMPSYLSKAQFDQLSALPEYVSNLLADCLTKEVPESYAMIADKLQKTERGRISVQVLEALQRNNQQFFGSDHKSGWIASNDRENNLISLLGLLLQRQELTAIDSLLRNRDNRRLLGEHLQKRNGHMFLDFQIPIQDINIVNNTLKATGRLMCAMQEQKRLMGEEVDHRGSHPLKQRMAEFFAYDAGDTEFSGLPAPHEFLALLTHTPALDKDIRYALTNSDQPKKNAPQNGPGKNIQVSGIDTTGGIRTRSITLVEPRSFVHKLSTSGEEGRNTTGMTGR